MRESAEMRESIADFIAFHGIRNWGYMRDNSCDRNEINAWHSGGVYLNLSESQRLFAMVSFLNSIPLKLWVGTNVNYNIMQVSNVSLNSLAI